MIVYNREDKKLVVPSALGNFGNAGGGSGSGLTPDEVAEIASAVTEAAIEEYDTEIQVDLEEIRDAISGNTDTLLDLAVIAAMSVADRVALFDEVYDKASNGERIYIKGLVQEETVRTAVLPLVSYRPETNPVLHQGGNLYFAAKGDTDNIYFHIVLTSEGSIDPTSGNIIKRNIYNLPTASAEVKGGVRIGSGLTMAQDVISVDTTGLVTDGDLAPFVAELSATTEDLAALSGSVNDIRSDVGTLSGTTSDILSDIEALSGATVGLSESVTALSGQTTANTSDITALSAATEAIASKADAAASGLATLSGSTEALSGATVVLESGIGAANTNIEALSGITESVSGAVDTLSGITEGVVSDMAELSAAAAKNYFVDWSALYDMDYAPRRAAFIELAEKRSEGYTIYASGKTAANGYDVILPLVDFIQGTWSTDRYNGGWAKFGGICASGETSGYYGAEFNSAGNIGPNARYFSKTDFYTLKNATVSRLGGIKVGSGLTIGSDDKLSVNIGEGLAFSGDTLVVSGISGGGGNVFVITDVYGDVSDLSDFLFQYRDAGTGGMTSGYPGDTHILLWLGQDWMGALDPHGQGYVELFPISSYEEEGIYIIELVGVYADNGGTGYAIKIGVTDGGTTRGNSANALMNLPREIPQPAFVRFGNDGRGGLTYDADNNRFEYDSGYITPGDTSTVYPDLIDKLFTDYLVDGGMVFDYLLPVNLNRLSVIESGETREYACPSLSRRDLPSTVTIDGVDFDKEITYYYGEWKLTAYYGGNGGNEAANVRISRL